MSNSIIKTSFLSFSLSLNKFLDFLSRSVRFDLCPTNPSVTVSFGSRHRRFSRSDGSDAIFQQINLRYQWAIWVSAILTLNRMDVDMTFFSFKYSCPFPLQNLVQRLRSQPPSSVSSTPNRVSAISCVLFGNPLRTFRQYLASPVLEKSRFFLLRWNFPP